MIELEGVHRLNFGCGYDKREGYLNVDMDPACEPDVLLVDNDLSVLPQGFFEEILALDVLEHIPRLETPSVLLDFSDMLTDGGTLRLKTSSINGVATQIAKDPTFKGQYTWTHCLFGSQAHEGDFHLTGFTETTLTVHLLAAGFAVDRMWTMDRWLLHAEATKVTSWSRLLADLAGVSDGEFLRRMYPAVLDRDADEDGRSYFLAELASGRMARRDVTRRLMSSPERLFVTAQRHGFARPAKTPLAQRVRPYVPSALVPPLQALRSTTRAVTERGRRALGALNGHALSK